MDDKTFKIVTKVYTMIANKRTELTDSDISYILGLLETIISYNSEDDSGEKKSIFQKLRP